MQSLYDVIEARNAELSRQYEEKASGIIPICAIPTGIPELDNDTGFGEIGILTGVMAHPGDGKSSVARMLLKGAALAGYSPRAWFVEDPLDMVADSYTGQELNESAFKLRRLKLGENTPKRLSAATNNLDWARQVYVSDDKPPVKDLIQELYDTTGPETGMALVDYAQAFGAEFEGQSVERVLANLAWELSVYAKRQKKAVYLMLQPRNKEVMDRGDKHFQNWKWNAEKSGKVEPDPQAVYGYRPLEGDVQWASAVWQRIKYCASVFRPGRWMKARGMQAKDDTIEFFPIKGNYSPGQNLIKLGWHGETTTISSRKK